MKPANGKRRGASHVWPLVVGAFAVAAASHACLIDPQKDFPVGVAKAPEGGQPGQGSYGPANTASGESQGGRVDGNLGGAPGGGPGGQGGTAAGGTEAITPVTESRSCAEWQARGVGKDDTLIIDPDNDGPVPPFSVFCYGMEGPEPLEYLELPHTDATGFPNMNTSTFSKPGDDNCACPDSLSSSFPRVRLRVSDLTVLVDDRAFAVFLSDPTCHIAQGTCEGEHMGFGEAADCRGAGIFTGRAEIDLGDTPFHISPAALFAAFGYTAGGSVDISKDRKHASVTGGGFCGGYGPADPAGPVSGWPKANELKLEQD